jgi:hypothetical protein
MRSTVDGLIYWKLLNAFEFNTFLEIGIYQGLTTGLFFESNPSASVTAIDPCNGLDLFKELYPDAQINFKFINDYSSNVKLNGIYDFILIDGDHRDPAVWNDIESCLPLLSPNGVLAIDDYKLPGVALALEKLYNANSGLVPFLKAEQTIFWHRASNDRGDFLDGLLTDPISKFIFVGNQTDHLNNVICSARTLGIFTDITEYFDLALKHYNI